MQSILSSKNTKFLAILGVFALFAMFQIDFASAAEVDWTSTVETEVKKTGAEVTKVMLLLLAVGLGIFGLQWGVRKALKFFKSTTN